MSTNSDCFVINDEQLSSFRGILSEYDAQKGTSFANKDIKIIKSIIANASTNGNYPSKDTIYKYLDSRPNIEQPSFYTEEVAPKLKGAMTFSYGSNKANGIKSSTTFEAIKNGERTATTRYTSDNNIKYWQQAQVGDVIEFHDSKGEKILVRVTKPLTKLDTNTSPEEWSKKEGWSTQYYNDKVLSKVQKGEAYQIEYEYINPILAQNTNGVNTTDTQTTPNTNTSTYSQKEGIVPLNLDKSSGDIDFIALEEYANTQLGSASNKEEWVNRIAYIFSTISEEAYKIYKSRATDSNIMSKRAFIVNNSDKISDRALKMISEVSSRIKSEYRDAWIKESEVVTKCWYALLNEAADIIKGKEGVLIGFTRNINEQKEAEFANSEELNQLNEQIESGESQYSTKDGWQLRAKEIPLRNRLADQVKSEINWIKRTNKQGKFITDKYGMPVYYNEDYVLIKLQEAFRNVNSPEEFDKVLNNLSSKYTWSRGLVQKLNQGTNESEDLKALFYRDLITDENSYYVHIRNKEGKRITKRVNEADTINYSINSWRVNYEAGNILKDAKINGKESSIYNETAELSSTNARNINNAVSELAKSIKTKKGISLSNYLTNIDIHLKNPQYEIESSELRDSILNPSNLGILSSLLACIGIDISPKDLENQLLDSETTLGLLNRTSSILSDIDIISNGISKKNSTELTKVDLLNEYKTAYKSLANTLQYIPQNITLASFREMGKSYQSTSYPSYFGRLKKSIKGKDGKAYLDKEFGAYGLFQRNGQYTLQFLRDFLKKSYRDILNSKIILHIDGVEFNDCTEDMYLENMLVEFDSETKIDGISTAYYFMPLLSDAPSNEFIRWERYVGDDYKDKILNQLVEVARYELDRIKLVQRRALDPKVQKIDNFDTTFTTDENGNTVIKNIGGAEFKFFPYLNTYLSELLDLDKNDQINLLKKQLKTYISEGQEAAFEDFKSKWSAKLNSLSYSNDFLENFFYNNALAYCKTVLLTTTDLAYYKDLNDFQKRFKETYAMTQRLYTNRKYNSGYVINQDAPYERCATLKDVKTPASDIDIIRNIIKKHTDANGEAIIMDIYKNVNVTDAQAIRSLSSYRNILLMAGGMWTDEMEESYNRITSDKWDLKDFNTIWLALKPFVYAQISVNSGNPEIGKIKVPIQHKNSEIVALSMFSAITKAYNLPESSFYKNLNDFMTENQLDLVQFESAVKVGGYGKITVTTMKDDSGKVRKLEDNEIQKVDYNDYGIQVSSTEHLLDHQDLVGTQYNKLIEAGIPEDTILKVENLGEVSKQEFHDIRQRSIVADVLEAYNQLKEEIGSDEGVAKVLQRTMANSSRYTAEERAAITIKDGKFVLPVFDPIQYERIQQVLCSVVKNGITKQTNRRAVCVQSSNVGYVDDLHIRYFDSNGNFIFTESEFNGLSKVNPDYKKALKEAQNNYKSYTDYRESLNLSDCSVAYHECYLPAYAKKFFQHLIGENGMLDINKLPNQLRKCVSYRVPTEAKYSIQALYIKGFAPTNNGSMVMLPKEITAVTGSDFDFDKMFILLPEFSLVDTYNYDKAWADFYEENPNWSIRDINKNKEKSQLFQNWISENIDDDVLETLDLKALFKEFKKRVIEKRESGEWFTEQQEAFYQWFDSRKNDYISGKRLNYIKYNNKKSVEENSRKQRANLRLNMTWGVLQNKNVASQAISPGNFEELKDLASFYELCENLSYDDLEKLTSIKVTDRDKETGEIISINYDKVFEAVEKLQKLSPSEIQKANSQYTSKLNPLSPTTQINFHNKNAVGGKMISVYAVSGSAHAIGQYSTVNELVTPLWFLGKEYQKLDSLYASNGKTLIASNIAQFLAASVDNVKFPILATLMQNEETGDITTLLLRLGVSKEEVCSFLIAYKQSLKQYKVRDVEVKTPDEEEFDEPTLTPYTLKDLNWFIYVTKRGVLEGEALEKVVKMQQWLINKYHEIRAISKDLSSVTQNTRFDTMNAAAGPYFANEILKWIKLDDIRQSIERGEFTIKTNTLDLDFILDIQDNSNTFNDIEAFNRRVRQSGYPSLQAMCKLGNMSVFQMFDRMFPQLGQNFLKLLLDRNNGLRKYVNFKYMKTADAVKLINTFIADSSLYALRTSPYFSSLQQADRTPFENKIDYYMYYLKDFPALVDKLKSTKEELKDNSFVQSLEYIRQTKFNPQPRLELKVIGEMTNPVKARFTNEWASLLTSKDDEIRSLGYQLFSYEIFRGLRFAGNGGFIHLAPNSLRTTLKEYNKVMDNLKTSNLIIDNEFINQFIRNYIQEPWATRPVSAKRIINTESSPSGEIITYKKDNYAPSPFISVSSILEMSETKYYRYIGNDPKENYLYKRVERLGSEKGIREYFPATQDPISIINSELFTSYNRDKVTVATPKEPTHQEGPSMDIESAMATYRDEADLIVDNSWMSAIAQQQQLEDEESGSNAELREAATNNEVYDANNELVCNNKNRE